MTADDWAALLSYQQAIAFYQAATALGVCWVAGALSLKILLYIKNHRDLW